MSPCLNRTAGRPGSVRPPRGAMRSRCSSEPRSAARSRSSSDPSEGALPEDPSHDRRRRAGGCARRAAARRGARRRSRGCSSAARLLVGRSARRAGRELLDEQRVALGRLRDRVDAVFRQPGSREEAARRGSCARLVERARAAAPCRRAGRRPSPGARRGAPAGRARGGGRERRGRARPGSRGGRAGSGRPSGCPRTGAESAPRAASDSRRTRAEKNSVSRSPTALRSRRGRGAAPGAARARSAAAGADELDEGRPRASPAPRRARRCRRPQRSASRAARTRCTACSSRTASTARGSRVRPPSDETCVANSSASRDLPMPAGPKTVTSCGRRSLVDPVPDPGEGRELAVPADHRDAGDADARPRRDRRLQREPGRDRLRLPLRRRPAGRGGTRSPLRVAAYVSSPTSDGAHRCARTGAGRRCSPRRRRPSARPGSGRASSSTIASPVLTAMRTCNPSSLRPVADGERRAHGSLGIVAVGGRRAEEPHHRVADELLDPAAEALDLRPDALVVGREERPHVLGVELLGPRVKPTRSTKRTDTTRRSSVRAAGLPRAVRRTRCRTATLGVLLPQRAQVCTGEAYAAA